jgi:hypothetical protein
MYTKVVEADFELLRSGQEFRLPDFRLSSCFELSSCGRFLMRVEYYDSSESIPDASGAPVTEAEGVWAEYDLLVE